MEEPAALASARRLFERLAAALEAEIEDAEPLLDGEPDRERIKALQGLIRDTHRALLLVLELRVKLERRGPPSVDGALDLEAAREEIAGRLARLAERG